MKTFLEFLPILVFVALYKFTGNIYLATGVLMATATVLVVVSRLVLHKVERSHQISYILLMVLGGATLLWRDVRFLQWKPTVLYIFFAFGFLLSHWFFGGKTFMERMLGDKIAVPVRILRSLNYSWVVFFLFMAALNLYVAYSFSEDTWVTFKLFGLLGLTLGFSLIQGVVLWRFSQTETPDSK